MTVLGEGQGNDLPYFFGQNSKNCTRFWFQISFCNFSYFCIFFPPWGVGRSREVGQLLFFSPSKHAQSAQPIFPALKIHCYMRVWGSHGPDMPPKCWPFAGWSPETGGGDAVSVFHSNNFEYDTASLQYYYWLFDYWYWWIGHWFRMNFFTSPRFTFPHFNLRISLCFIGGRHFFTCQKCSSHTKISPQKHVFSSKNFAPYNILALLWNVTGRLPVLWTNDSVLPHLHRVLETRTSRFPLNNWEWCFAVHWIRGHPFPFNLCQSNIPDKMLRLRLTGGLRF